MIGRRSIRRSIAICIASERFHSVDEAPDPADHDAEDEPPVLDEEVRDAITISVGAGRSAPKLVNTSLNAGMTKIMITEMTMIATTITEIG